MKVEDQVCTLEQAKTLKNLGVSQETFFSWFGNETPRLMDNGTDGMEYSPWVWIGTTKPANGFDEDWRGDVSCSKPIAAAFTVAELGAILKMQGVYTCVNTVLGGWAVNHVNHWPEKELPQPGNINSYDNEAEARADILIYHLESKQLTEKEASNRLITQP